MIIFIYWVLLFIFEIVLFILSLKKKDKFYWRNLYKSIVLNIGSIIVFEILYYLLDKSQSLNILIIWLEGIVSGALTGLLLIVSLIINKIIKSKITDNDTNNKTINRFFIVFSISCILFTILGLYPLVNDIYRRVRYTEYAEQFLTEKYGDGNFKVLSIYDERSDFMGSSNNYCFTISTSYMSKTFELEMDIDTKEIESDDFIVVYVRNKKICNDGGGINNCLDDSITEKMNKKLTRPDVYNVELSVNYEKEYINEKFGHIPEVEELEKYTKISFNNFMIEKELKTTDEEEFKQIVLDMYNDYIKYLDKYNEKLDKNIIRFRFRYSNPFYSNGTNRNPYAHDGYFKIEDNRIIVFYKPQGITLDINNK